MSASCTRPSRPRGPALGATAGAALALALLALAGCRGGRQAAANEPQAAVAVLHPARGNEVSGAVRFERVDGALRVQSDVTGLAPGAHGYHVHVYGDCSAPDAASAGPHFDFEDPSESASEGAERITGNLGELVADGSGHARHETRIERARLAGPASIVGRAVIVHERGNDPQAPPSGDAGGRVACGVIGLAER